MSGDRRNAWMVLFERMLVLVDAAHAAGAHIDGWSFGGGTALMRRHNHRFSKDIDIFVSDPQCLGFFSPRISSAAETMTNLYIEQSGFVKLLFREGEIDIVASAPLTASPTVIERILDRDIAVETSAEIIAKKVWHRGADFTARDVFDLAMVAEKEPAALREIRPILQSRSRTILTRLQHREAALREDYAALEILEYERTFDECRNIVETVLGDTS